MKSELVPSSSLVGNPFSDLFSFRVPGHHLRYLFLMHLRRLHLHRPVWKLVVLIAVAHFLSLA